MARMYIGTKIGLTDKGVYSSTVSYRRFDSVSDEDSSYYSLKENNVGHPLTDVLWWKCYASGKAATAAAQKANDAATSADTLSKQAKEVCDQAKQEADKATENVTAGTQVIKDAGTAATRANTAAERAEQATSAIAPTIENDKVQDDRLTKLEGDVVDLKSFHGKDFCLGKWAKGQMAPEAIEVVGNKNFALNWYPWFYDMTDNKGPKVKKAYSLKKNNWFRRASNGKFSPAVCITPEDWALCDAELYLDAEHTQKYCDAGSFNAEAFYNEYGVSQLLYGVDGVEIAHIRRPWETTNKNYGNGVGRKETIYLCDHQPGSDGNLIKGVFTSQSNYDGAQFGQFKLDPTILAPTPVCTVGGKTRSFFYLMKGEGNCQSGMGKSNITDMFRAQKMTYPRVNDMQQINNMRWARANNADPQSPVPFAEGGFHALNVFISCMEIGYGTKFLHAPGMFSSGVSSNDSCGDESTWKSNGGVRYRKQGEEIWKYAKWGDQGDIYYAEGGKRTNMSETLNDYYPKVGVNEGQVALSYAAELGIKPGVQFVLYGQTYWYEDVAGATSLLEGEMNARLYKLMPGTVNGFNADGTPQVFDVEVVLRVAVMHGMNLSGDIFAYWGGGYEQVGINDKGGNGTGFPIKLYLEPDQNKWLNETSVSNSVEKPFTFEKMYIFVGETVNPGDSYMKERVPYTGYPRVNGGSIGQGECCWTWNYNWWNGTINTRTRIASRPRGLADSTYCSRRYLDATNSVTYTSRYSGGSAQVENGAAECNALQAQ